MSDKTIAQKLQVKEGYRVLFVNAPKDYYKTILSCMPKGVIIETKSAGQYDIIQTFITSQREIEDQLVKLKSVLKPKGILWATYPKGTSEFKGDINRDTIREYASSIGLQAVAIFSVDQNWSALRLKLL